MDEFFAIADDLNIWEHQTTSRSARKYRSSLEPLSPALKQFQAELHHLAVLVCVMTSAANALENRLDDRSLAAMIVDFCPKQPTLSYPAQELALLAAGDQIVEDLQDLQARLSFAQMLTKHLDGKFRKNVDASTGDIEILADAWRRTSARMLAVLNGLGISRAECGTLVVGFLKNCLAGGSPCLNENGGLEIPGWAERRKATRISVQQTAQASTGGALFDVSVLNASTVGLGLTGDAKSGQRTKVIFADGREVSGTVKWSEDGRFGLQLDQPLAKSDRLLASAPDTY